MLFTLKRRRQPPGPLLVCYHHETQSSEYFLIYIHLLRLSSTSNANKIIPRQSRGILSVAAPATYGLRAAKSFLNSPPSSHIPRQSAQASKITERFTELYTRSNSDPSRGQLPFFPSNCAWLPLRLNEATCLASSLSNWLSSCASNQIPSQDEQRSTATPSTLNSARVTVLHFGQFIFAIAHISTFTIVTKYAS